MVSLFSYTIFNRTLVELNVIKDRIPYRENMQGRIENVYLLRIINKDQHAHTYTLEATGLNGLTLDSKQNFEVQAGEIFLPRYRFQSIRKNSPPAPTRFSSPSVR